MVLFFPFWTSSIFFKSFLRVFPFIILGMVSLKLRLPCYVLPIWTGEMLCKANGALQLQAKFTDIPVLQLDCALTESLHGNTFQSREWRWKRSSTFNANYAWPAIRAATTLSIRNPRRSSTRLGPAMSSRNLIETAILLRPMAETVQWWSTCSTVKHLPVHRQVLTFCGQKTLLFQLMIMHGRRARVGFSIHENSHGWTSGCWSWRLDMSSSGLHSVPAWLLFNKRFLAMDVLDRGDGVKTLLENCQSLL